MEKIRQNIFGIGEVYELQKEGQWVEKNRESYREYGYFGGGYARPAPNVSTIDRIDYSNDTSTASVRGSLSSARSSLAASGNSNFGYFGGGLVISTVNRVDYSNDTNTASTRGSLSIAKHRSSSTGNSNFGYFTGGHTNANVVDINYSLSTIDRIDFSNDLSTASIKGSLNQRRTNHSAIGNSNFGWILAGNRGVNDSAYYTSIERINYANDTSLTSIRGLNPDGSGQGNSATGNDNFGYQHRGVNPSGLSRSNIIRINYSNDLTNTSTRTFLLFSNTSGTATGNSNFGYFGGGLDVPAGFIAIEPKICRIDYANDTVTASARGSLSVARSSLAATSSASFGGSPVSYLGAPWVATAPYGYFSGAALGALDRVDYTNDTAATTLRSQLSNTRNSLAATGNNSYGYYGGGFIPGNPPVSLVDRIDYSNDSAAASVRGSLSVASSRFAATGTSNFGYFAGGGSTISVVSRIDYANDSIDAIPRGPLSVGRRELFGCGNKNFGYYGGGLQPGGVGSISSIERIDYSNDSATAVVRNTLSSARFTIAATGNENFGYTANAFGVGAAISQKIDYANDTSSLKSFGLLSNSRLAMGATGNSNFGYFGGGNPGPVSIIDRIDYSNDTQTASTRGPLSSARSYLAASSSQAYGGAPNTTTDPIPTYIRANTVWDDSNTLDVPYKRVLGSFGYFISGYTQDFVASSITNRIDYSNDTLTASVRGSFGTERTEFSGSSTSNFGYAFAGIEFPASASGAQVASTRRIDYSNDLSIFAIRGSITITSRRHASTGNANFAYITGGPISSTNRVDYSNDAATALIRGPLSLIRENLSATGNSNFGYFGGGNNPSGFITYVDRITYSNDTARSLVRGPLSLARGNLSATGNSNFGYFGGGYTSLPATGYSIVNRIDYSNDTPTTLVRGPLSLARGNLSATGNSNFGYFGGGLVPAFYSRVDRIDYSNDTAQLSIRGPLNQSKLQHISTTNARNS